MKIIVSAKVNAKQNIVEKLEDGKYLVHTTAIPVENKANEHVIELLAEYFGIAKSRMKLIRGKESRSKIIEII